jgi:alpha-1,2-mannosyltransferase
VRNHRLCHEEQHVAVRQVAGTQATRASTQRPIWFDAFVLGVLAFVVFAATASYHDPLNNDTRTAAIAAWQLAHHGNATLSAFYGHYAWLFESHGRFVTNRLPGTIFWATPFYAVLGGGDYPAVYPGAFAADAACALAVALTYALCCRIVSRRSALVAASLLGFATGTWTVSADQLWTHGPAQAAVLLVVLLSSKQRWLLAGIPAGFAILVRPHLGVVALVICGYAVVRARSLRPLLIGVGSAAGGVILLAYNYALWHRWEIFGGYDQPVAASGHKAVAIITGLAGDLISPERGLLVMTPALLLLLPGLRRAWAVAPDWIRAATCAGLAYLLLQLWGIRFSGGDGFYSYRTTLETLTLCVPLLALAWREWTAVNRLRRTAFAGLAAVSVALHAFGAIVNWVPRALPPWMSFMPIDLAHHIGAAQTAGWVVAGSVLAVAATAVAWRYQSPEGNSVADQHELVAT